LIDQPTVAVAARLGAVTRTKELHMKVKSKVKAGGLVVGTL
jgi:hypothetical protein